MDSQGVSLRKLMGLCPALMALTQKNLVPTKRGGETYASYLCFYEAKTETVKLVSVSTIPVLLAVCTSVTKSRILLQSFLPSHLACLPSSRT